jgi:deoxycytidine triphosphate deaminase
VVLSDRTIARLIGEGRIGIDPYDESLLQPSSVDVRVDRYFRVFHNARYPYIDVKQPQEELTEQVEVNGDQPFILHPGEFVLGSTLERVALPDDLVARLEGKALALDTEVPTPSGWTTMGQLEIGDIVFTERGAPTVVIAATGPMVGRPCRELSFANGESVVCDVGHQWVTTGSPRGEPSTVETTAEIEEALSDYGHPRRYVTLPDIRSIEDASAILTRTTVRPCPILDVRTVPTVAVRCIEVSSPSGQFLVTRSYIPTHNSSLGRLGLLIHSTAGFIDPGFDGHVTLELSNVANLPITIYHGMKIGQISFMLLSEPTSTPYGASSLGSKYQGQRGPTPSRYWQNFAESTDGR